MLRRLPEIEGGQADFDPFARWNCFTG